MFTVNATELRQAAAPPLFTDQEMQQILRDLGTFALDEIGSNFEALSRRRSGIDGERWKELTPTTEIRKARKQGWRPGKISAASPPKSLIGVDDGFLRNAIIPSYSGPDKIFAVDTRSRRVTVGFGRNYADDFDAVRPLIPSATPSAWVQNMEKRLEEFGEDLLRQQLTG